MVRFGKDILLYVLGFGNGPFWGMVRFGYGMKHPVAKFFLQPGNGNDDLPWLYTQPLQNIEGC